MTIERRYITPAEERRIRDRLIFDTVNPRETLRRLGIEYWLVPEGDPRAGTKEVIDHVEP